MNINDFRELQLLAKTLKALGLVVTVDKTGVPRLRDLQGKFAKVTND